VENLAAIRHSVTKRAKNSGKNTSSSNFYKTFEHYETEGVFQEFM